MTMNSSTGVGIEAVDLVKTFGSTRALDGVSFTVPSGSVFGVIGPNGAGKTTIMRSLLDLIRLSSGRATLLGTDSRNAGPELRRRIGDRNSTRLNSSHYQPSRMPSSA